jgi:hypothetical protein
MPVVVLVCGLLPATAEAQFTQQGPKLVATDAVGAQPELGSSVALSGDGNTAIVGGPGDNVGAGAAWVYTRSREGWTQQAKLVGTGIVGSLGGKQGSSVALSADGNTAIIGGIEDNDLVGAAWVFTRSAGVWRQQAKLVGTGSADPANQGHAVALSGDGNTAIVGGIAANDEAGAAWVFTRAEGMWSQQATLFDPVTVGLAWQGASVSLSDDGDKAIVGGPLDNGDAGAAWVYTRSGGVWSQQGPKLVGTGAVNPAQQGFSVSLSRGGITAIEGGFADNSSFGAAWVFAQRAVFAGTPGKANCHGKSVSALVKQYGGLNRAAAALGYPSVKALQEAIEEFCEG